jgi:hypothetical protein
MPNYRLYKEDSHTLLADVSARDQAEALQLFGQKLGCKLSLEGPSGPPAALYLMSEIHGEDWRNPTIHVYVVK